MANIPPQDREFLPSIDPSNFDYLKTLIIEAIKSQPQQRNVLQGLLVFIDGLRKMADVVPSLKTELNQLRQQVLELGDPPLQYGVFLGVHAEDVQGVAEAASDGMVYAETDIQRGLIIGVHGQRHEVNLATRRVTVEQLKEGQEVVLNQKMNVVGVRNQYVRGDTAEVANIISPSDTAKVIAVPDQGDQLEVQWAGGDKTDKFLVVCPASLRRRLKRGDIVQLEDELLDSQEVEEQIAATIGKSYRAIAKVKPRLHVRSGGSEGIVVEISNDLFEAGVDIGDIVRVDTRLQFAFEKLPSYQTGGLALEDVPNVTFEDIGGLDDEIGKITDAIELPYLNRKLFDEYQLVRTKGIMLYGPPGCGKTMIAKAIANNLTQSIRTHLLRMQRRIALYLRLRDNPNDASAQADYCQLLAELHGSTRVVEGVSTALVAGEIIPRLTEELRVHDIEPDAAEEALRTIESVLHRDGGIRSFFLNIKGPELLSKWVGESEHRIRKIFEEAKRNATFYTPVVIFFDEMEAMFRARGSGRSSDVETTIVPQFLSEMDGVEGSENVIIIGASNRPDSIDPAVMRPGRLDVKIKVDRPDREAAQKILALNLTPDLPLREDDLKRPPATIVRSLTFKPHIIRRTLMACTSEVGPDMRQKAFEAIPQRFDVRRALVENAGVALWNTDKAMMELLSESARREQLAEAIITELLDLLYSPTSRIEAVTTVGRRHIIPLRNFVSGALLVSVVARAKKAAVKRRVGREGIIIGIGIADLRDAVKEEFEESAEQMAANALERELAPRAPGQPGDMVQLAEVFLNESEDDPWRLEKLRPYRSRE